MRRKRGTKQHSEWSRSRILILAVTFLVSAGLGTFGISAVERMNQLAAINAAGGNDKFCVDKFNQLKDKEKALKTRGQRPAKPPEEEIKTIDCTWSGVGGTVPSKCGPGGQQCVGDPSKANKPPKEEPKKEEPKGEPKMPELPKPPEKKPKEEKPKDDKCQQDPNSAECKRSQKPFYCNIMSSLPGCGGNEGQLPQTSPTDDVSKAISDLAQPDVNKTSETSDVAPSTAQQAPVGPTGPVQKTGAQTGPTSPSSQTYQLPQGYTPQQDTFGAPAAPITEGERASFLGTLGNIAQTIRSWFGF